MIKINNVDIKTPKSFQVSISDLDGESNRNARGELIRDRIAVKRKLECEWPALTQAESSAILNAVVDVFFTVTYPDPKDGVITLTCYVGDRTMPMYSDVNNVVMWNGLKMNFVEK